jgi:hypothetical protein
MENILTLYVRNTAAWSADQPLKAAGLRALAELADAVTAECVLQCCNPCSQP